jgi:hypothetical protein
MLHVLATVAVGGMPPALSPGRWDAAPLLLAAMLALLLWRIRVRLPAGALLVIALVGGTVLDLVDAAIRISTATTIALIGLGIAVIGIRRRRTPRAASEGV